MKTIKKIYLNCNHRIIVELDSNDLKQGISTYASMDEFKRKPKVGGTMQCPTCHFRREEILDIEYEDIPQIV